jgi:hypothetical protein
MMKAKFTLIASLVAVCTLLHAQQFPNPSFDNWGAFAPTGWSTYESIFGAPLNHSAKDSVDKVTGPYSVKIMSDSVPGQPGYGVLAGALGVGGGGNGANGPEIFGIPFAFRPDTLIVLYKFSSPGVDTAAVNVKLIKSDSSILGHHIYGVSLLFPPRANWTNAYAPLRQYYTSQATPDTLQFVAYSSKNPAPHGGVLGSVLHMDGIQFVYASLPSALQEVSDKLNIRLYPNPATNVLNISTDENVEGYRAVISSLTGQLVSGAELSGQNTTINVSELAAGTYICRVADKNGNVLKQERFNVVR